MTDDHRAGRPRSSRRPSAPTPSSVSTGARRSSTSSGRRRWWYAAVGHHHRHRAGLVRGQGASTSGIDFKGGTSWEVTATGPRVPEVQLAVQAAGVANPTVQILGQQDRRQVQADLQAPAAARCEQRRSPRSAVAGRARPTCPPTEVSIHRRRADLGEPDHEEGHRGRDRLLHRGDDLHLVPVRVEDGHGRLLIAVIHDLLITIGIYLAGRLPGHPGHGHRRAHHPGVLALRHRGRVRPRSPRTRRGSVASGRMTYTDIVNLSMNQTLARSHQHLAGGHPARCSSVLVIGAQVLGATTLQYFGLALVIGIVPGPTRRSSSPPRCARAQRARAALHQHPAEAREPARATACSRPRPPRPGIGASGPGGRAASAAAASGAPAARRARTAGGRRRRQRPSRRGRSADGVERCRAAPDGSDARRGPAPAPAPAASTQEEGRQAPLSAAPTRPGITAG